MKNLKGNNQSVENVKLNLYQPVFCEMKNRNDGYPFQVSIVSVSETEKTAIVRTQGEQKIEFSTRIVNLFN